VITCSNKKCVVVYVIQPLTGASFSHLVKYFVAGMIYLAPDLFDGEWIGPTKSIAHFSNTCKVICGIRGISSLMLGLPTL
jgi:hypothetical protein